MEITKMSAAQLTKAMDKASLESSKITNMLIDAGRGYERPSDMLSKSDPLSLKYQKNSNLLQDLYAEKNRRITYHGNLRPVKYQENPMATKKFSPAQLAAQKLFAERARSGTLKKGKRKATRKTNPEPYNPYASRDMLAEYAEKTDDELRYIIKDAFAAARAQRGTQSEMKYLDQVNDANTILYRRKKGLNEITGRKITRRANPAKKTVSEKISQLVHEGYPQKQAVAVALSEERAAKVKHNPEGRSIFNLGGGYFGSVSMSGYNEYYAQVFYRTTDSSGSTDDQIVPDYKPRYFTTAKSAVGSLMRYKTKNLGRKTNPSKPKRGLYDNINAKRARIAAGSGERMRKPGQPGRPTAQAFKRSAMTAKRNPASGMVTGYQVICMHPKKHVVGIFKTMAEAKQIATAMANAHGVAYAVKTIKVHKAHFAV